MGNGAKAVRWSLALGAAALSAQALRQWLRWRGSAVARRFLYVTPATGSGEESLWLAELAPAVVGSKPLARTIRKLTTVPGDAPVADVPESFAALIPSPGNLRMAVRSVQLGTDFIDHNVRVADMSAGTLPLFFNEHRFSGINRASCTSVLFDAFLATEAAAGVPPDMLASYDWQVLLEGAPGANIPTPELGWADDETLVAGFRLLVVTNLGQELGEELFRFRIAMTGDPAAVTQWSGPLPAPPPPGPLSIASASAAKAHAILYKGVPLPFLRRGPSFAPGWSLLPRWRAARKVAGLIG